jgi:hypothetical protein
MSRHGFSIHRQSKHLIWRNEAGQTITTSSTPSDGNALRQIERQVRRLAVA